MFQIEVDREKALVLLRIVQRHAFGNQMIVLTSITVRGIV